MLSIILFCLLLCVLYAIRGWTNGRNMYKLPPGYPGELPIIGHAHILVASGKDLWSFFKRLAAYTKEKEGVIYFKIFHDTYYVITDPADSLTVANTCLQKHFMYRFTKKWLGQGLITGSGEIYNVHRKILNPKHAAPVVHSYLNLFNEQAKKLCDGMSSFCEKSSFNPVNIFKDVVLETACYTTFGSTIIEGNLIQNYIAAVDKTTQLLARRISQVHLHNDFIYALLGYQKEEDILINNMTRITNKVIQEKKAAFKNLKIHEHRSDSINYQGTYKSMLDYLVEQDDILSDIEIREELDTNVVASFDSIVRTLMTVCLLAGTYPEVQDNIYQELKQVLGKDKDVEKQDLQKFVYTKAVIKESLRVLPTIPVLARFVEKDVKLKEYTMPAKSQCVIVPYGIHRSPAWGSDADQFKPERWLDASLSSHDKCFAGFSLGKRACIGMTYSVTFLTVMLVHLVRQYKWTADITKVKSQFHITLQTTEGDEISIERRSVDV